jgi:hypothetical protein
MLLDGRRRYCRLAGVEDDFFRPFVRRLDPDNRPINGDRLIGKHRRRYWHTPAGHEQQSDQRASDEHKIPRYGHACRSCYAAEALRFCRAKQRLA